MTAPSRGTRAGRSGSPQLFSFPYMLLSVNRPKFGHGNQVGAFQQCLESIRRNDMVSTGEGAETGLREKPTTACCGVESQPPNCGGDHTEKVSQLESLATRTTPRGRDRSAAIAALPKRGDSGKASHRFQHALGTERDGLLVWPVKIAERDIAPGYND